MRREPCHLPPWPAFPEIDLDPVTLALEPRELAALAAWLEAEAEARELVGSCPGVLVGSPLSAMVPE